MIIKTSKSELEVFYVFLNEIKLISYEVKYLFNYLLFDKFLCDF